jgi:HAMP domain-containing protein
MDVPIDVDQTGEIGELAKAIERMRTSLKAAIERLRR